jgi:hypothetical protein
VSEAPAFRPAESLAVLDQYKVAYVLIGGFAAQLHGSTLPTTDIDVTPATSTDNLERLAAALRELGAGIRVDDLADGLAFDTSAEALAEMRVLNLRTRHGDLDLTFEPAGTGGYDDLTRTAAPRVIAGVQVEVASLADIIRSKQAAARPKDLHALPELERLAQRPAANDPPQPPRARHAQRNAGRGHRELPQPPQPDI